MNFGALPADNAATSAFSLAGPNSPHAAPVAVIAELCEALPLRAVPQPDTPPTPQQRQTEALKVGGVAFGAVIVMTVAMVLGIAAVLGSSGESVANHRHSSQTGRRDSAPSAGGATSSTAVNSPVAVGDCLALTGTTGSVPVRCGSLQARYRVTALGRSSRDCPTDGDNTQVLGGRTACLDIDWTVGNCLQLDGKIPRRVACTSPTGVRVVRVLRGSTDSAACGSSSDRGIVYPQRRITVCLANL